MSDSMKNNISLYMVLFFITIAGIAWQISFVKARAAVKFDPILGELREDDTTAAVITTNTLDEVLTKGNNSTKAISVGNVTSVNVIASGDVTATDYIGLWKGIDTNEIDAATLDGLDSTDFPLKNNGVATNLALSGSTESEVPTNGNQVANFLFVTNEIASNITVHAALPSSHHTKYTDPESTNAVATLGPLRFQNTPNVNGSNVLVSGGTGDGTALTGVNAATLDTLDSTDFALRVNGTSTNLALSGSTEDIPATGGISVVSFIVLDSNIVTHAADASAHHSAALGQNDLLITGLILHDAFTNAAIFSMNASDTNKSFFTDYHVNGTVTTDGSSESNKVTSFKSEFMGSIGNGSPGALGAEITLRPNVSTEIKQEIEVQDTTNIVLRLKMNGGGETAIADLQIMRVLNTFDSVKGGQ